MNGSHQFVIFGIEEQLYGLPLAMVARVLRSVEPIPLTEAPQFILGLINVQGTIIPLLSGRTLFGFPAREVELSDRMIITGTGERVVALLVDSVVGVAEFPVREILHANEVVPGLGYVERVAKLNGRVVLIVDPGSLLSLREETAMDHSLSNLE